MKVIQINFPEPEAPGGKQTFNNVHQQFAEFFQSERLKPYAYLVSKKLSEGHICLRLNEISEDASAPYDISLAIRNMKKLQNEALVTTVNGEKQPFVLHKGKLYLQRYFNYETEILERLKAFVQSEQADSAARSASLQKQARLIRSLFASATNRTSSIAVENIDWQLIAAATAVLNNFTIITGGPGTGKTTTVAKILAILYTLNPDLKVALAAPTGKAAARMADSLKAASVDLAMHSKFETIAPVTIHRLLKYIPDTSHFKHNKENPVNYDTVIVDESSMIDAALFAKLLQAIGPGTRLIMLGDKDQLASVEAGSLFGDLCRTQASVAISKERAALMNSLITDASNRITADFIVEEGSHLLFEHIVELRKSHRFSSEKGIGKFSKAIIRNDVDTLREFLQNTDSQVSIDQAYDTELFKKFADGYAAYIEEPDTRKALQKLNSLRVLCAVREGEQGLYALNEAIEIHLRKKKLLETNTQFYKNRPVIITKNYYPLGLFNGDVGIIRPDENGIMKAWFEDTNKELKAVLPGYIAEAETVFAMTIHKSQGSEYDSVLVVLPNTTSFAILTRELLYTGVTRAKSMVILQAGEDVLLHTAAGVVKRASGITERFDE